jgi:hypothetical protein
VFSDPDVDSNGIWHNRSFNYDATGAAAVLVPELSPTAVGECAAGAVFSDTAVLGSASTLTITGSVPAPASIHTNGYCNGERWGAGPINVWPTADEGGNTWIDVRYGPLSVLGEYSYAP